MAAAAAVAAVIAKSPMGMENAIAIVTIQTKEAAVIATLSRVLTTMDKVLEVKNHSPIGVKTAAEMMDAIVTVAMQTKEVAVTVALNKVLTTMDKVLEVKNHSPTGVKTATETKDITLMVKTLAVNNHHQAGRTTMANKNILPIL